LTVFFGPIDGSVVDGLERFLEADQTVIFDEVAAFPSKPSESLKILLLAMVRVKPGGDVSDTQFLDIS